MKKSLVAALTSALVVGATATTFAAANPFSDVPEGHWATAAIEKLASEGIVEGYGDGTYRGNRNITRYEMAQMVARALTHLSESERRVLANFSASDSSLTSAQRAALRKYNEDATLLDIDDVANLRMLIYGGSGTSSSTVVRFSDELTDGERNFLDNYDSTNVTLDDAEEIALEKFIDGDELDSDDVVSLRRIIYGGTQQVVEVVAQGGESLTDGERAFLNDYDASNVTLDDDEIAALNKFHNGSNLSAKDVVNLRRVIYGGNFVEAPVIDIIENPNADLAKLSAYFDGELRKLGVRVDKLGDRYVELDDRVTELEKHADMVQWHGKIEYTYGHLENKHGGDKDKNTWHDGVFRLEPSAYLNSHWTANARFDAAYNGKDDNTNGGGSEHGSKLKRIFAQGDFDKFSVTLGRFGYCPAIEDGIVADTVLSGAELSFGSKWKFTVDAGRVGYDSDEAHYSTGLSAADRAYVGGLIGRDMSQDDHTDFLSGHISYNPGDTGLYGQASYYYAKDRDFRAGVARTRNGVTTYTPYSNGNTDKAGVWAVGLGYKVNDLFKVHAAYAKNTKADYQNYGWDALAEFGNYNDAAEAGNWSVWGGYSRFGDNVALASSQGDDVQTGAKGWHVGAAYAPWKHVGVLARYSDGKWLDNGDKYKKVFARVEFMF